MLALADEGVEFVVIGGYALQMHGSSYVTMDLDIAYERSRTNAVRLVGALERFGPRPRGMDVDLPFVFDAQSIMGTTIMTLETSAGDVDLLGRVIGLGDYGNVAAEADTLSFEGRTLRVLSIDGLLRSKRAAARSKDEPGIVELEALREARDIVADERDDTR